MNSKQILATALAATSLLTMAAPAMADNDHNHENDHGSGKYKHEQRERFADLGGADWAELGIEKAFQLGLMVGQGPGKFNPQAPLRREEAIVAAIRLMGLGDDAKAQAGAELHFTDAKRVDSWAVGSIAVAVGKNVLPPAGDGELRPQDPASRLWASVLLVKALGYDAEAQAKMNAELPFADAKEIPANLKGYVAAAVDHKLVSGYEDKTFKPNKSVTRAEMASLLGRGDDQLDQQGKRQGQVHGTVQAVDATLGTLTVTGEKGTVTAKLKPDAAIFVDGKAADIADVKTGMKIWVKLDADLEITFVDAKTATPDNGGSQGQSVTGTIYAVAAPVGVVLGSITVKGDGAVMTTASIAPLARISFGTQMLTLADLKAGDQVKLELTAGIVTKIEVKSRATVDIVTAQGHVVTFTAPTTTVAGSLYLQVEGQANVTYAIPAATQVVAGTTAKAFADVTTGAKVRLTITASVVTKIDILP